MSIIQFIGNHCNDDIAMKPPYVHTCERFRYNLNNQIDTKRSYSMFKCGADWKCGAGPVPGRWRRTWHRARHMIRLIVKQTEYI